MRDRCLQKSERESLAERIISDHMRFVCADGALRMWSERCRGTLGDVLESMVSLGTRRKIVSLVESRDSLRAFEMCEDMNVFGRDCEDEARMRRMLCRLVFVDLLRLGRHMDAVSFVRRFMADESEDRLFTLIGYRDVDDPRCSEIAQSVRRECVLETLNRHLFKKEVGREHSLLFLALNHHASIVNCQKK